MDGDRLEVLGLAEVARERVGDERAHRAGVGGDDGERRVRRARRIARQWRRTATAGGSKPSSGVVIHSAIGSPPPTCTRAEAGEVGQPAGELLERRAGGVGVLAEHLGLLAHLAAGGDREVGEAALGARAVDVHAGGARSCASTSAVTRARTLGACSSASAPCASAASAAAAVARLLAAAVGQAEVTGVAGCLAVTEEPDLGHGAPC